MIAEPDQFKLKLGSTPPAFKLPATDGKPYTLESFASKPFLAVVFSCNHCPYVQAWEDRLIQIAKDYAGKGVQFVLINSNETTNYPTDDFPHMVERAKMKGYPFPYLRDESQEVARAYGALVTPHVLVFDKARKLAFQGTVDDNHENPSAVERQWLRDALEAVLGGKAPPAAQTPVKGCSVKWAA